MRTEKVEGNQIVIRDGGACVKYDLALIEKQISKLESQLETWREYKRLLTQRAPDALCDCYISVPAGSYPDLCAHCGKKARR